MRAIKEELIEKLADHLLTPKEAATALRVSPRTLWSLKEEGALPHVRIGRLVRYPRTGIEGFISRRSTGR